MYKKEKFIDEIEDFNDFRLVTERERAGKTFVHIVPNEYWSEFRQWQIANTYTFDGEYVNAGRRNNKETKIAFFNVRLNELKQGFATTQ